MDKIEEVKKILDKRTQKVLHLGIPSVKYSIVAKEICQLFELKPDDVCPECKGSGLLKVPFEYKSVPDEIPPCPFCHGTGKATESRLLTIDEMNKAVLDSPDLPMGQALIKAQLAKDEIRFVDEKTEFGLSVHEAAVAQCQSEHQAHEQIREDNCPT